MLKQKFHVCKLSLLLIFLFSVLFSACGSSVKGESESLPAETQNELEESKEARADQGQKNNAKTTEKQKEEDLAEDSRAEEEEEMLYRKITGDEAAKMMSEEITDVVILDVRTEEEYKEGHIPNAVLLPYDSIREDSAAEILPDQSKKILVYCRTGRRSEVAAMTLTQLGYREVYDFGGIMTDWNGEVVK